jgi:hypothetical protein
MTLALAWLVFPAVLAVLALGCGLLLEAAAGARLRGALMFPLGFGVIVVVAQLFTLTDPTAEFATPAVVTLACAGLVLSPRRREPRLDLWACAAAVAVFCVLAAPIVLSGEPTIAGYMKNEDTATWLAITDHVMEHGRSLSSLPADSYQAILDNYVGHGYPVGAFLPLGVGRALVGQDLAWLFQPYMAFVVAMLALALYALASDLIGSRTLRALAVFVASQPALLFGNSLWGELKEPEAAMLLAATAALFPHLIHAGGRWRRLLPIAVASAATLGVLSVGGAVWLAPALVIILAWTARDRGVDFALPLAATLSALVVALSIPALVAAGTFLGPASNTLTRGSALGNLIQPLSLVQVFGVWPVGDFRLRPDHMGVTDLLIALVAAAAVIGVVWAFSRRAWGLLLYVWTAVVGATVVVIGGSPWVDAKALATASPALVLAGMVGAAALLRRRGGPRLGGALLAAAITAGVLWSNALAYHDVDLAPHDRLAELQKIGKRIAGEGPTLTNEYEFYAVRHFLRKADPDGASLLGPHDVTLRDGLPPQEGVFADIDQFDTTAVLHYRTLVLRRSPAASRPPAVYREVWKGRYYEVWQRPSGPVTQIVHLTLGQPFFAALDYPQHEAVAPAKVTIGRGQPAATAGAAPAGFQPATRPRCRDVLRLARLGGGGGVLATVVRPRSEVIALSRSDHPPAWSGGPGDPNPNVLYPSGEGTASASLSVRGMSRYEAWLGGSFRGRMELSVDGRRVSSARHELNYSPGQFVPLGQVTLDPGLHRLALNYALGDLHPGSGGSAVAPFGVYDPRSFSVGPLILSPIVPEPVTYLSPSKARSLCGRNLDWVELLAARPQ